MIENALLEPRTRSGKEIPLSQSFGGLLIAWLWSLRRLTGTDQTRILLK
jgi:hypothetical protein